MSIVNPLQPINMFSNLLHSILDVVTIANADVLNHIILSLIKSLKEYKQQLLEIKNLVESNPNFVQFSGYDEFYENFGGSSDSFEKLLELMESQKDFSSEFKMLYNEIDDTYSLLLDIIDTVSIQEALYLDKKLIS